MAVTPPRTTRAGYDTVAGSYDSHFCRRIDEWEDDHLAELLDPVIDGRDVLDLGCGTGWILDHLSPGHYVGVDRSRAMGEELRRKHPGVDVYQAEVGSYGWTGNLPLGRYDTVVATWAAEYFLPLRAVLAAISVNLLRRPGIIALHGCQPRGSARGHFIDPTLAHRGPPFRPGPVAEAATWAGLPKPVSVGIGATPDVMARWRPLWRAGLRAPVAWHYSALHTWLVG